ncbi:hypothetical protein [Calidithermus chliarophilus]|uniref:hypothetical protein n=1 Tax=Calidithermus chliarophilus TaxID=52023 RepID=UPI0004177E62|nr:hypothetical protein [Calidithermus chliarophilus]
MLEPAQLAWVERLFGGPGTEVRLLDRLPQGLPAVVPLPQGHLFGGYVQAGTGLQLVFDVPRSPSEFHAEYLALLEINGWEAALLPRGGFVGLAGGLPSLWVHAAESLQLQLQVGPTGQGSDVRLSLSSVDAEHVERMLQGANHPNLLRSLLPTLVAPAGVRMSTRGGGGGGDFASSQAELTGAVIPGAVLEHFNAQLREAGWRLLHSEGEAPLAYSLWELPKVPWRGTLTLQAMAEAAYLADLCAYRPRKARPVAVFGWSVLNDL